MYRDFGVNPVNLTKPREGRGVNGGAKLVHRGGVKLGHSAVGCLST